MRHGRYGVSGVWNIGGVGLVEYGKWEAWG